MKTDKQKIKEAEKCGLTYTKDPKNPYIGTEKAWNKFDKLNIKK